MKALGLEKNIDMLVPDHTKRPSYHIAEHKEKQRVRKNSNDVKKENSWKWDDEE